MSQLAFKWPARESHAREDFIVSGTNEEAVRLLETWPHGQAGALLLSGPEACGKTHLAACWADRTQARFIDARTLGERPSEDILGNAAHAVLEDIHAAEATALFHLLRHAEAHGHVLLMTSRPPARELPFTLPDLRSRLLALPAVAIHAPDEALLGGFLFKALSDRQLRAGDDVIDYLLRRMERSFAAALALAEALEAQSLASGRNISLSMAKALLA